MALDFDSRLGLAGLIMALFGIAATYLWPDKKWIGWSCLVVAVALVMYWGVTEIKQWLRGSTASFVISICIGAILGAGLGALVWFSSSAEKTAPVVPLTPLLTWDDPAAIIFGTPLSDRQLNAFASVPGHFTYSPEIRTILPIGRHPLMVNFVPNDTKKFEHATKTVYIVVNPIPPNSCTDKALEPQSNDSLSRLLGRYTRDMDNDWNKYWIDDEQAHYRALGQIPPT